MKPQYDIHVDTAEWFTSCFLVTLNFLGIQILDLKSVLSDC